jgi:hypothetical protein
MAGEELRTAIYLSPLSLAAVYPANTQSSPDQSGPVAPEMGIHCERCHGPGLEHSRLTAGPKAPWRSQDREISNPGRLDQSCIHSDRVRSKARVYPAVSSTKAPWGLP